MPSTKDRTRLALSPAARCAIEIRAASYKGQPELSTPASDMIERYDRMVRGGIWQLKRREGFTARHFCCAVDALNGTLITPDSLNYVGDEVAEAIRLDGLGEKWELGDTEQAIEAAAVLFESLGALEMLALADIKERYWRGVTRRSIGDSRGDDVPPVEFWEKLEPGL